jgi:hypothetical protein
MKEKALRKTKPLKVMLRRVAESAFAVQIETKRSFHLCVSHQQFTEGKRQNVGTVLLSSVS